MIVFLQQIKSFKDYVGLYLKGREDDEGESGLDSENSKKPSVVHEVVNKRWEVCVTTSTKGFQQASFVNSIATFKVHYVFGKHQGGSMDEQFGNWSIMWYSSCNCIMTDFFKHVQA